MSTSKNITTPPVELEKEQGWHRTTDLCMDVKTLLRSDCITQLGKDYAGVLRRDGETHYEFIETQPQITGKRNPHVFDGRFITVTRRDDGSYRLNFKPLKVGADFSLESYAIGVYNEICMALAGLIEK